MNTLIFILISSLTNSVVHAADCRASYWQQMDKNTQKLQPLIVSNQYLENLAVKTCEIQNVKKQFEGSGYEKFCPVTKSKLKVECFKDWLKSQDISYTPVISLLDTVATSIALKDKASGADGNIVTLLMIDANLIPLERMSTSKNVAFTPTVVTPAMRETAREYHWKSRPEEIMKLEKQKLRQVEKQMFAQMKVRVLPLLEQKLSEIRAGAGRRPASVFPSDRDSDTWVKNAINSLDERIQKLKAREI